MSNRDNKDYSYLDAQLNANSNLPQYGGKKAKPQVVVQQVDAQGIKRLTRNDPSYKRPKEGTAQEKISDNPKELAKRLQNQIKVPTHKLCNVPLGTWVRYVSKKTGQYRAGGLLRQIGSVDDKTAYLVLANPYTKISWSAQVKENTFYIEDKEAKDKEQRDKDRVYKAYQDGLLVKRKKADRTSSSSSRSKPKSGTSTSSSSRKPSSSASSKSRSKTSSSGKKSSSSSRRTKNI